LEHKNINLNEIISELTIGLINSNPMENADRDWGNPIATAKEKDQVYLAVKNSNLLKSFKNIKVSKSQNYQDEVDGPIQDNSSNAIDIEIPYFWKLEVKIFRRMGGKTDEPKWFNHLYEIDFLTTKSNKKEGQSAVGDVDKLLKLKISKNYKTGILIIVFSNDDIKKNGVITNFEIQKYMSLFELIVEYKYKGLLDVNRFKNSKVMTSKYLEFDDKKTYIQGLKRIFHKNFHNKLYVFGWEVKKV